MTGWPDEPVHFVAHLLIVMHRGINFFIGGLFLLLTVGCVWSFGIILVLFSVKDLNFSSLSLVFNLRFDGVEVFERFEPSLEKDVFLVEPSDSFLFILDFELDKHFLVIHESLLSLLVTLDFLLVKILIYSFELLLKQLFDHGVLMVDSFISVWAVLLIFDDFILHGSHHGLKLDVELIFVLRVLFGLVVFVENPVKFSIRKVELILISNILSHELHHESKLLQALLTHGFDDLGLANEFRVLLFFQLDRLLKCQIFLFVLFLLPLEGIDFLVPLLNEHESFHYSVDLTSRSLNVALDHPFVIILGLFTEVHGVAEKGLDSNFHDFLFLGHNIFKSLVKLLNEFFVGLFLDQWLIILLQGYLTLRFINLVSFWLGVHIYLNLLSCLQGDMVPYHFLDFVFWHILIDKLDEWLISRSFLPGRYRVFGLSLIVLAFQFLKKVIWLGVSSDILNLFHKIHDGRSLFSVEIFGRKILCHVFGYRLKLWRFIANVTLLNLDNFFIWNFAHVLNFAVVFEETCTTFDNFLIWVECIGGVAWTLIGIHNHRSKSQRAILWSFGTSEIRYSSCIRMHELLHVSWWKCFLILHVVEGR